MQPKPVLLETLAGRNRRGALIRQETDIFAPLSLENAKNHDPQPDLLVSNGIVLEDKNTGNKTANKRDYQKSAVQETSGQGSFKLGRKEKREVSEWGATLGNEELSVAERLSLAVKIHSFLCDAPTHSILMDRVDGLAHTELLMPLLALARVVHPLNYVALRLLLLFTHTPKSLLLLSQLGTIPTVMVCLSRPQELECIRYCLEILRCVREPLHCRVSRPCSEGKWTHACANAAARCAQAQRAPTRKRSPISPPSTRACSSTSSPPRSPNQKNNAGRRPRSIQPAFASESALFIQNRSSHSSLPLQACRSARWRSRCDRRPCPPAAPRPRCAAGRVRGFETVSCAEAHCI